MNCFYHPGISAVGICKSCGKGLCPDCATDLGQGLACRHRCEADVTALLDLTARNIRNAPAYERIVRSSRGAQYAGAVFLLLMGSVFAALPIDQYFTGQFQAFDLFPLVLGMLFFAFGILNLLRVRKLKMPPRDSVEAKG
jgi:hypothetical protein